MKIKNNKTFILGIDGATFDIINPLLEEGRLPNMQKIIQRGVHGNLLSTIPSISAPAWVAFMTGKNPGNYGTYHFRKIDISNYHNIYSQDLINSSMFSGNTFFDYLGKTGYKVGVVTVPVTYPPWPVNGFLISGYPCPDPIDIPNFTFPDSLSDSLPGKLNWTEMDSPNSTNKEENRTATHPKDILKGGMKMMSRRAECTLKLMKEYDSDVTVLVWGAIDRAQHILWKYHDPDHILYQPDNPYKDYIKQLYCHADKLLGKILEQIDPEDNLFIISDHGFGPKQGSLFHLNAWLNQNGYLKTTLKGKLKNIPLVGLLKRQVFKFAATLDINKKRKLKQFRQNINKSTIYFNKTAAYMFPIDGETEGVVINLKERQLSGIVTQDQYEALRTKIIEKLSQIKDPSTGKHIVKECYRREELYTGINTKDAPDIIVVLEPDYSPGGGSSGPIFSEMHPTFISTNSGTHRREGIFIASGPHASSGKLEDNAFIWDVAPTVLYAMGEKIPDDMEGNILRSAFSEEKLKQEAAYINRNIDNPLDSRELTENEQESMKNRLRDLGYL